MESLAVAPHPLQDPNRLGGSGEPPLPRQGLSAAADSCEQTAQRIAFAHETREKTPNFFAQVVLIR